MLFRDIRITIFVCGRTMRVCDIDPAITCTELAAMILDNVSLTISPYSFHRVAALPRTVISWFTRS